MDVDEWLALLKTQTGKPYVFGSKGPAAFDCSGLIYWTLKEVGVRFGMGSWQQAHDMEEIPVEDAYTTPGALLYYPKEASTSGVAHIAVSLGGGKTIEARNPEMGVGSWDAAGRGWTKAGLVPGVDYGETEGRTVTMCNPATGRVSSEYGWRGRISWRIGRMLHAGIDIASATGTPVYAAFAGTVEKAGWNIVKGRTGQGVLVRNPDGEHQYYGHLSRVLVRPGQSVAMGGQIGLMGATGNVTGPHLHFECWDKRGVARNPRIWFRAHGVTPGKANMSAQKRVAATRGKKYYSRAIDGNFGKHTVIALQNMLQEKGYYPANKYVVDGNFGPATAAAWQRWLLDRGCYTQAVDGITRVVDGVFGKSTVKGLQTYLRQRGFYGHEYVIDGDFGPATVRGIQSWLRGY